MFHNLIINVSVKNENTLNIKTKTCVTSFRLITGLKAPGHVTSPGEHKNADRLDWHLPERYFKNTTVHYLYMGVTIVRANVRSCRCVPFGTDGQIQLLDSYVVMPFRVNHFFRIVIRRYFYLLQLRNMNSMP